MVTNHKPDFMIGSPPCTPCCNWNQDMNYRKTDQKDVDHLMKEERLHLKEQGNFALPPWH